MTKKTKYLVLEPFSKYNVGDILETALTEFAWLYKRNNKVKSRVINLKTSKLVKAIED